MKRKDELSPEGERSDALSRHFPRAKGGRKEEEMVDVRAVKFLNEFGVMDPVLKPFIRNIPGNSIPLSSFLARAEYWKVALFQAREARREEEAEARRQNILSVERERARLPPES